MKRLLAFFVISLFLFAIPFVYKGEILNDPHISQLVVVSKENKDFEKIQSGEQFYYKTDKDFSNFAQNFNDIDGLVLYFNDYSLEDIAKDYKIDYYKGADVENYQIYYGYTNLYNKSYLLNSKKINVQIAVRCSQIIVGFPAILTGF